MSLLKIKISLGDYGFELEGDTEVVDKYFEDFKKNGLPFSDLKKINLEKMQSVVETDLKSDSEFQDNRVFSKSTILLKDVAMRQLPGPESEWILIYAYYASNKFSNPFKVEDIKELYKNPNRWTPSNRKNFSKNLKSIVNLEWIRSLTQDEYVFIDKGKDKVKEILDRKTAGKKKLMGKKSANNEKKDIVTEQ